MTGSVGLAGSANIGDTCSMFEAIHGSAPRRAGQNIANPSGLLLGAVMMLVHIGQTDIASKVHNAWLKTIEDGLHTYDIYKEDLSKKKMGTREFGQAVVERLGEVPKTLKAAEYKAVETKQFKYNFQTMPKSKKELVGVDVFVDWSGGTPDDLGGKLSKIKADGLKLTLISNRGLEVWPGGQSETFCVDHWRCRFEAEPMGSPVTHEQIIALLGHIKDAGFDFIKTENLYNFDGVAGFSTTKG
jgi:isocitrate dehydrogenase